MKIALAQINPTVGDIAGNLRAHRDMLARARDAGARLVVFPEMSILGYPPKDLLLKPAVVDACRRAADELTTHCTDGLAAIVGLPLPADREDAGRSLYNAALLLDGGTVAHRHVKSLLPTYDVFDEHRYFEPGPPVDIATLDGLPLGISVCEDLWNDRELFSRTLYHDNPIDRLADAGAKLHVNCSASPFVIRKHRFRLRLMSHVARKHGIGLLYCNQVGGNDELVFDGRSCAFDAAGRQLCEAAGFEEDLVVVEWDGERLRGCDASASPPWQGGAGGGSGIRLSARSPQPSPFEGEGARQTTVLDPDHLHRATAPIGDTDDATDVTRHYHEPATLAEAFDALVLGVRDYVRKCGFERVVLGLSGGIDSALTCAVAVQALGPEAVRGVALPSRYSSTGSVADARGLAEALQIRFDIVPIKPPHEAFESALSSLFEGTEPDVTEENIQARCRGVILMALSNKFGSLLLTTGNKSELAVGYCTLYGDMAGGLAVINDVPKTMVYALSRWINEAEDSPLRQRFGPVIPEDTITKPPSAELRPDQHDQQSLPPYDVLDTIIERYVEREHSAARIAAEAGIDRELVVKMTRLIDRNEYKRRQAAPGLKITGRAFGFGRRMPIAMRWDHGLTG
jgi:NAD+ synthetase